MRALPLLLLLLPALSSAAPVRLPTGCLPVCETNCLKPFAIPDRWDDVTLLPGHDDWQGNGRWDAERLVTDVNGNGLYDAGDGYDDANGNGAYDAEAYHPLLTGYIPEPYPGNTLSPDGDLGIALVLKEGDPARAEAGHYNAVDLADGSGVTKTGASAYRAALEGCVGARSAVGVPLQLETGRMSGPTIAAVLTLIQRDPAARWDPAEKAIVGSIHPAGASPRLVVVPLADPRFVSKGGRGFVLASKLAAFFIEEVDDRGTVRGRLLKFEAGGPPCACCGDVAVNWLRNCP